MAKHTEGPWRVDEAGDVVPERSGSRLPGGRLYLPVAVARVGCGAGRPREEALANARLIASAPAMRAALELCADALRHAFETRGSWRGGEEALAAALAALEKAREAR